MVQPDEEILTLLGGKFAPGITQKLGGTFDWEEATFMQMKKAIDKIEAKVTGKTYKGLKAEREIEKIKDLQQIAADRERSLKENKGLSGWLRDPQSWYLTGHKVEVGKQLKRIDLKKQKLDTLKDLKGLKVEIEQLRYKKGKKGRK